MEKRKLLSGKFAKCLGNGKIERTKVKHNPRKQLQDIYIPIYKKLFLHSFTSTQ
jgi:hypothetical protein